MTTLANDMPRSADPLSRGGAALATGSAAHASHLAPDRQGAPFNATPTPAVASPTEPVARSAEAATGGTAQSAFRAALTDPGLPAPVGLTDGAGRPAGRRFDVYRNNVAVGLAEALEQGFPTVRKLVGDVFFRAMAGVYLRAQPPDDPRLMLYGAGFPGFVRGFKPAASVPYLASVARLDLAIRQSYHAADADPVDPGALAALPPHRLTMLRLRVAPALRLVKSRWPIHAIWRANQNPAAPKPEPVAQAALVSRPAFDPVVDPLTPAQALLLDGLMQGQTLGALFATAPQGTDPAALLGLLLARNAIIALDPAP